MPGVFGVLDGPVDAFEDAGVGARAVASEDFDGDEVGFFGLEGIQSAYVCCGVIQNGWTHDSVFVSSSSSSTVSSVTLSVVVLAIDEVCSESRASAKLVVLGVDSGIDHIDIGTFSSRAIVDIRGSSGFLVTEPGKTPVRRILREQASIRKRRDIPVLEGGSGVDLEVWLDMDDARHLLKNIENGIVAIEGKPADIVDGVVGLGFDARVREHRGEDVAKWGRVIETSNPGPGDCRCGLGADDCWRCRCCESCADCRCQEHGCERRHDERSSFWGLIKCLSECANVTRGCIARQEPERAWLIEERNEGWAAG